MPSEAMTPKRKPWGMQTPKLREPAVHVDEIEVNRGGYCSIHKHVGKYNLFIVTSGLLCVTQYEDPLKCPNRFDLLGPGKQVLVPAKAWHRFACLEDCLCQEIYWPSYGNTGVADDDIVRKRVGGWSEPSMLPESAAQVCLTRD